VVGKLQTGLVVLYPMKKAGSTTLVSAGCIPPPPVKAVHGFGNRTLDGYGPSRVYGHTFGATKRVLGCIFILVKSGSLPSSTTTPLWTIVNP